MRGSPLAVFAGISLPGRATVPPRRWPLGSALQFCGGRAATVASYLIDRLNRDIRSNVVRGVREAGRNVLRPWPTEVERAPAQPLRIGLAGTPPVRRSAGSPRQMHNDCPRLFDLARKCAQTGMAELRSPLAARRPTPPASSSPPNPVGTTAMAGPTRFNWIEQCRRAWLNCRSGWGVPGG